MPLQIADYKLQIKILFHTAWWYVRQVTGDAAYENYLRHARLNFVGADPSLPREESRGVCPASAMTREEFYLDALRRRYSGVSRCC